MPSAINGTVNVIDQAGSSRRSRASQRMPRRLTEPWSEKVLTALMLPARTDFIKFRQQSFVLPSCTSFKSFMSWVIAQTKERETIADKNSSSAAHRLFDYICQVGHKNANKSAREDEVHSLSIADRLKYVKTSQLPPIVTQCYKWSRYLVRYSVITKNLDTRPRQMFDIYGELDRREVKVNHKEVLHMPSSGMKSMLQVNILTTSDNDKVAYLYDFQTFLYIFAICHQAQKNFKCPRRQKRKRDVDAVSTERKQILSYCYRQTAKAVGIIFEAWQMFAKTIGFKTLSDMVFPFFCVNRRTGQVVFVSDKDRLLPTIYKSKLYEVDAAEGTLNAIGVPLDSEIAPEPFRRMSTKAISHLRQFTNDLFDDITRISTSADVFIQEQVTVTPEISSFLPRNGVLPSRFTYNQSVMSMVQAEVHVACGKHIAAGVMASHTAFVEEQEVTPRFQKAVPKARHVCKDNCACSTVLETLRSEVMNGYCTLVRSDFKSIVKSLKAAEVDLRDHSVQLLLTDPPRNLLRALGSETPKYEQLERHDMQDMAHLAFRLLKPGGHVVLFCSAMLFADWQKAFARFKIPQSREKAFLVESSPLIFLPQKRYGVGERTSNAWLHDNISEFALHAVRCLEEESEPTEKAQLTPHGHVHSRYQPSMNIMDNVPAVTDSEIIFQPPINFQSAASRAKLRAGQKSVSLFRELVCRYSKPEDLVLDPFAGTFTTAEACLSVEEPRRFLGGDSDFNCVKAGSRRCLHAVLRRAMHNRSDNNSFFNVSDDVRDAAALYYDRHLREQDRRNLISSDISPKSLALPSEDIPYTQLLPDSVRANIACRLQKTIFMTETLAKKSPDKWPRSSYTDIILASPANLRAAECARFSIIPTKEDYLAAFNGKEKGDILGHYYGTLVYVNLRHEPGKNVIYGGGIHQVDRDTFKSLAISILPKNTEIWFRTLALKDIFIVPATYCPFRFARFSQNDDETNATLFVQPAKTVDDIIRPTHVVVRASKMISPGLPIILSPSPIFL